MTNGINASYVNVDLAADVLYMHVNTHFICKMESRLFAEVENDMALQFKFYVHLFGRIRRQKFIIIQL